MAVVVDGLNSLQEVLGGPGVGGLVDVLPGAGGLEQVAVDAHAVSGHAQGQLVDSAVSGGAGADDGLIGAVDDQIGQVNQVALGAPVGDQTLGTLEDDVGGSAGLDSGVDSVVTVGVVQVLDSHVDVGVDSVEVSDQAVDGSLVAPLTDGVGSEGDADGLSSRSGLLGLALAGGGIVAGAGGRLAAAGNQTEDHDDSQGQCKKLLHGKLLLKFFVVN